MKVKGIYNIYFRGVLFYAVVIQKKRKEMSSIELEKVKFLCMFEWCYKKSIKVFKNIHLKEKIRVFKSCYFYYYCCCY